MCTAWKKTAVVVTMVVAIAAVMFGALPGVALAEKKIGILIWSDEPRYEQTKKGILEALKKKGYAEPAVKFTIENAGGNKAKVVEIAKNFAAAKFDMVIACGTSAAVPVAKEIKDVPVVFSMVYDPVESKIADSWKSSGNNTTGASPKVSMSQLMSALKQAGPVKRLAVLYTPGEKNSEIQLKDVQAEQGKSNVKIMPVPLTSKEEVEQKMADVVGATDAIYLTGSSIVGATLSTIIDMANKAKVITVTHLEDMVEKGALLGVCANPYQVGILAGEKAVKILKGAKPSSVPIEMLEKQDVIINMKTVKAGQFQLPAAFVKSAARVIE
ncbi:MAG TPA: hypothetical protein DCS05_10445 [Nitrospiraceae bacterium]|jgi:putative tryptophan/tyrosine transport system substrate-binding protein|nr:hypothetical protein [Nitrospiraceae bacterium]